MITERIQKILARAGFGSRRECEKFISDGRVKVNSERASLGSKADAIKDRIEVDGVLIKIRSEPLVYIAIYKPRFVLSHVDMNPNKRSSTYQRRKTILDFIDLPTRLFPVGRLDLESEGLMLLTNDGELANRITHPRYGHEKEYRVLLARHPDDKQLGALRRGVVLEDGYRTLPAKVWMAEDAGRGAWSHFILTEGRKRQIREMCGQLALPVVRLVRIRIGSLLLGRLKPGEWRFLSPQEVATLYGKNNQKKVV